MPAPTGQQLTKAIVVPLAFEALLASLIASLPVYLGYEFQRLVGVLFFASIALNVGVGLLCLGDFATLPAWLRWLYPPVMLVALWPRTGGCNSTHVCYKLCRQQLCDETSMWKPIPTMRTKSRKYCGEPAHALANGVAHSR